MTYSGAVTASSSDHVKIAQVVVAVAANQIDFTSIPSTYTSLELIASNAATQGGNTTGADTVNLRLNDATTGYYSEYHRFSANAVTTTANASATSIPIGNTYAGGPGAVQIFGLRAIIHNYAKTNYRSVASQGTLMQSSTTSGWRNSLYNGIWTDQTTAVNKVSVLASSGLFQVGSIFTLYGLT